MTTDADTSDRLQSIEETLASFACESIVFTDEEEELIHRMEAEGLSSDERIARLKAYLISSSPKP
ncbi:MAG: hypothetical protein AB7I34_02835 [Rhizobiaceae bacterium]